MVRAESATGISFVTCPVGVAVRLICEPPLKVPPLGSTDPLPSTVTVTVKRGANTARTAVFPFTTTFTGFAVPDAPPSQWSNTEFIPATANLTLAIRLSMALRVQAQPNWRIPTGYPCTVPWGRRSVDSQ